MIEDLIRHDFKTVDKREPIGSVVGWLAGETDRVPVVLDREKPYGVLNEKGFLRSRLDEKQKIESYVIGTRRLTPDADLDEVLDVFGTSRIPHVPVQDEDGKLVGVVHALDVVLRAVDEPDASAERLMTETPLMGPSTTVGEAMHHFHDVGAAAFPVVDADGKLRGVLRRRTLLRLALDARPSGRKPPTGFIVNPRDETIDGYVESDHEVVRPAEKLPAVRDALRRKGFAVVAREDGRPVGVVTPEGAVAALAALH